MYYQSKAEIEDYIRQAGEQAVFEANCGDFHEELVKILGRLRYRTSYGQNVLKHTLEVVHLSGVMAAELGAGVKTAKRAALLHDIGKAMTHEVEGSHALISAQLARRYGETQGVVHAIEAHHYEVQPQTVEAVLLIAADAISASRPGARGESLENYIKRLESLEELAASRPGVEKVYALQAGREIRVIVKPEEVDDDTARPALARDRARDRGPARVSGADQGDGHPREPRDRRRVQPTRREARRPHTSTPSQLGCASRFARNARISCDKTLQARFAPAGSSGGCWFVVCKQPGQARLPATVSFFWSAQQVTEADEDRARAVAERLAPAAERTRDRSGRERVERVGHEAEQHEQDAEDEDLRPRFAAARIDELRQECEEEQRRLRVQDVDDDSLREQTALRTFPHAQRDVALEQLPDPRRRSGSRRPRA